MVAWLGDIHTLIELQKLECASSPPALLLGKPVVGIALILGRLSHALIR